MLSRAGSDGSFEHLEMDEQRPLRDITELSEYWRKFRQDLANIHMVKMNGFVLVLKQSRHNILCLDGFPRTVHV